MVDQPSRGDDDEVTPPEVTVAPWLRTGPIPGVPVSSPPRGEEPAIRSGDAAAERAGSGRTNLPRGAAPNRIRLGAGRQTEDPGGPNDRDGRDPHPGLDSAAGDSRTGDLSSLTLRTGQSGAVQSPGRETGPAASPSRGARDASAARARRIALTSAAGVAVLGGSAVLGFIITRGIVAPVDAQPAGCAAVSEPGRVVGDGPGSLDSPLETVLAFDHAYYVERSAEKAFEAVSPSSRITEEQLRSYGVERVPEGTTHCVEARELSPTLLEVTLTESPPDAEPVVIRQRVRVAGNPDGSWGIVSITPAG